MTAIIIRAKIEPSITACGRTDNCDGYIIVEEEEEEEVVIQ